MPDINILTPYKSAEYISHTHVGGTEGKEHKKAGIQQRFAPESRDRNRRRDTVYSVQRHCHRRRRLILHDAEQLRIKGVLRRRNGSVGAGRIGYKNQNRRQKQQTIDKIGRCKPAEIKREKLEKIFCTEILVFLQLLFGKTLVLFIIDRRKKVKNPAQSYNLMRSPGTP